MKQANGCAATKLKGPEPKLPLKENFLIDFMFI
jgi:hypothetical protein